MRHTLSSYPFLPNPMSGSNISVNVASAPPPPPSVILATAIQRPVGTVFKLSPNFRQDLRFVVVQGSVKNQLLSIDARGDRQFQLSEVESPYVWRFVETNEKLTVTFS